MQEPLLTSQDYLNEYKDKHQSNEAFQQMLQQRSQLPVFQYKSALIEAAKRNRVIVVKGATGCGKTTQVCNGLVVCFKGNGQITVSKVVKELQEFDLV